MGFPPEQLIEFATQSSLTCESSVWVSGCEGAVIESWLCVRGWELVNGCVASWLAWLFIRFWAKEPPLGTTAEPPEEEEAGWE